MRQSRPEEDTRVLYTIWVSVASWTGCLPVQEVVVKLQGLVAAQVTRLPAVQEVLKHTAKVSGGSSIRSTFPCRSC